ncbi:MAG TPA: S-layer homology domain-containing protein [Sedimentibacter sp.]|nr:S-layer homology domain-containing protein [Sedimentibacter sp.]
MKILKTTARKVILIIFVFVFTINTFVFAGVNPSREELELMIERVAEKRAIPAILLKAIARVESCYEHYRADGSPKINGTSIGLMQINNKNGGYDSERLKYDIMYNIEAGADVLLNKWAMSSYKEVASVGDMDPNVLENWYFALWAYNGWSQSNNPNIYQSYTKKYTYQQLIYDVIEKEYGGKIHNIDFSYLPATGKPSRSLVVPTPMYTNGGNIIFYEKGDYVRTDGIRTKFHLRDAPAGRYIHDLSLNQLGIIEDGPVLKNGYYWYKVYIDDNTEGWIERNFLLRTGDAEYGRYVFEDISFHWARKIIMKLYGKNIVGEAEYFNPDKYVSKEEFCILLNRALDYANVLNDSLGDDESKDDKDKEKSSRETETTSEEDASAILENIENINPWAVEYVENVYESGLIDDEDLVNLLDNLNRKEAALIIANLFEISEEFSSLDIETVFTDISNLNEDEILAIKTVYTNGIMNGKGSGIFSPDANLTRAEAAVVMDKISEKLSLQ